MKYDARLKMVQHAKAHGNKPAARAFGCDIKTVRKWRERYESASGARSSLEDRSHAPKSCPHKASPQMEARVVACRMKAPCLGERRLKEVFGLKPGHNAIGRILRERKLTARRKKKHEKKRDMRELKARLKPGEEIQVDVKYLNDIPFYVEQVAQKRRDLPLFEYTARDVRTGGTFLGFANELSEAHACAFIRAVGQHFELSGLPLRGFSTIQTDNGSEFSGMERTPSPRGFTANVRSLGAAHRFIPPGRKNRQADVESFHDRIEQELFNHETFKDRREFFEKCTWYQLWFNTLRKNGYKGGLSPDQIALQADPRFDSRLWIVGVFDLDSLLAHRAQQAVRPTLRHPASRGEDQPGLPERRSAPRPIRPAARPTRAFRDTRRMIPLRSRPRRSAE